MPTQYVIMICVVPIVIAPKFEEKLSEIPKDAPIDFDLRVLANWVAWELARADIPEFLPPKAP